MQKVEFASIVKKSLQFCKRALKQMATRSEVIWKVLRIKNPFELDIIFLFEIRNGMRGLYRLDFLALNLFFGCRCQVEFVTLFWKFFYSKWTPLTQNNLITFEILTYFWKKSKSYYTFRLILMDRYFQSNNRSHPQEINLFQMIIMKAFIQTP